MNQSMHKQRGLVVVSLLSVMLGACTTTGGAPSAAQLAGLDAIVHASVDSPLRSDKDRQKDAARKPYEVLRFAGVKPGQKVIDIFSATGWYAELLSRVVGPNGHVYAQNPDSILKELGDKPISERLANNRLPNVERLDTSPNNMRLKSASLDGALFDLVFHDLYWITPNVDGVLKDLHAALKHGAWVVVVDHQAPPGTRDSFAKDRRGQHRIDEAFVKERFAAAGFVLDGESEILREPSDDRTQPFFAPSMQGRNTDKFVLRFRRP